MQLTFLKLNTERSSMWKKRPRCVLFIDIYSHYQWTQRSCMYYLHIWLTSEATIFKCLLTAFHNQQTTTPLVSAHCFAVCPSPFLHSLFLTRRNPESFYTSDLKTRCCICNFTTFLLGSPPPFTASATFALQLSLNRRVEHKRMMGWW